MGVNNPDSISGRDDDATMMPDQQAATGQSYGGQGSLLDAIGSMQGGAVPNEAILSLLQGPSQGQRYAQAAAGGVAFMRGQPNPVRAIIDQQQGQQVGIAQMLQRMQTDQRVQAHQAAQMDLARKKFILDEQTKKDDLQLRTRAENRLNNKDGLTFLEGFKDSPNPLAQDAWTKGMSALSGQYGQPIPPAFFVQQLKIDEKEQDNIRGAIEAGATDEQLVTRFPKIATVPDYLATERSILQNPTMRAKLNYKTDEELRAIQYDTVTKKAGAWALENGFKVDSPEFRYANTAFREATGGRNIYDANPASAPDLMEITKARAAGEQQALVAGEKKRAIETAADREMADYNHKLGIARDKARDASAEGRQDARDRAKDKTKVLPGSWVDMQTGHLITPTQEEYTLGGGSKRYRNTNVTEENLLVRLSTAVPMARQLGNLIDGLLVDNSPDNLVNGLRGRVSQKLRNHPGWAQFNTILTDQNIELTGALGPGQFRTTLMKYLQDAGIQARDTREVARIVQDSIEVGIENRRRAIVSGGNASAMQAYKNPIAPKSPAAGAKLIDGNWVSQSGKYIWKDGQWTPLP